MTKEQAMSKQTLNTGRRRRWLAVAAAATAAVVALTGCGSSSSANTVHVVGFSILKGVNAQVISDFGKTSAGKGVKFVQSYGASGDQSRSVVAGLKADVVHFSLDGDLTRLVDAGLVASDWNAGPTKGIASQSVVVIATRPGNPKGIHSWADLVKPGVKIVTPDPGSSGSARWNILAAYGSVLANGGTDADAQSYLKKFYANVATLPKSGRDATSTFESGVGDVLISYENEAITARATGGKLDYFVPDQTLLIQNPAAVTKSAPKSAKDFLSFLISKDGQLDYAENGFRPLVDVGSFTTKGANDPSNPFPTPKTLLTIDKDFGGWSSAAKKFFDDKDGIVTKIQAATGK
jgi:sulfate/thiosulfate-binding protein